MQRGDIIFVSILLRNHGFTQNHMFALDASCCHVCMVKKSLSCHSFCILFLPYTFC